MPSRHTKQDAPSRASWALAGSAVSQGGPRRGLWTPVSVGPEHSPVGNGRWANGRRRGGDGIREKGWSRCAARGARPPWPAWRMAPTTWPAGWWQGEGPRDWMYMYTCIYVYRPSWSGVEGGVAPCRAPPARYRSPPPNEVTDVKASLVVGGPRAPRRRCGGARPCPGGCTGGRRAEGRCLPGPSRPRGTIPLSL